MIQVHRISRIGRLDLAQWEEHWRRHPDRTYYQSPAWNLAWAETWPGVYEAACLEIEFDDGCRLRLPGCVRNRAKGLESTFWSAPGNGPAGFLNPYEEWHPRREAVIRAIRKEVGSLLWTQPGREPAPDYSHSVDLTDDSHQDLFRKSRGGQYARQAESRGLEIRTGPDEAMLTDLLSIYDRMKAHWTSKGLRYPVYPAGLIRSIARAEGAVLAGVRDPSGQLLLAGFLLESGAQVASWFTFADPDHRKLRAQEFYFFTQLFHYRERGFRTFDFNPSAGLSGVEQFKEKFGAKPHPLDVAASTSLSTKWIDLIDRWRTG